MSHQEPPAITLSTTSSAPVTQTTTTTYTVGGGRRGRNATSNTNSLRLPTPDYNQRQDETEPFPALPSPTPNQLQSRTNDYFTPSPQQYQVRTRPISIRRLPSSSNVQDGGRPRSGSGLTRQRTLTGPSREQPVDNATANLAALPGHYELGVPGGMEPITEDHAVHHGPPPPPAAVELEGQDTGISRTGSRRLRRASNAARSILSKLSDDPEEGRLRQGRGRGRGQSGNALDYESDVVDYLDVLDPEVSTLTTLNNVQNAMFVPDIPFLNRYINRRPTYELSRAPTRVTETSEPSEDNNRPYFGRQISRQVSRRTAPPIVGPPDVPPKTEDQRHRIEATGSSNVHNPDTGSTDSLTRRASITSHVEDDHYAVLPHGVTLDGWSQEDVDVLDDYVRHMLHSRRSKFKRSMKGFGKYIRKPLGFFVTMYAFLITAFGFIWVLFLIGWISLGNRKGYIVHIVDSVLVALFAVMGDGLAPFRAIDTYHMIFIAHYHRLSWKLRKEKNLPKLTDHNDLPERSQKEVCADAEAGVIDHENDADWEFSVLTPEQQRKLVHHQNKFSKSHSYYRPHETTTHNAFPLKLLIIIVSLLDAHSLLQIMLGSFTWGWSYHTRPEWITAVILSISITVNISAGIIISVGDKRTRKKDVLLRMARQGLTEEAMRKVEREKRERDEETRHLQPAIEETHAVNVRQGVSEPRDGTGPTERGTEEVKEKLRGYRTGESDEDTDRDDEVGNKRSDSLSPGSALGGTTRGGSSHSTTPLGKTGGNENATES